MIKVPLTSRFFNLLVSQLTTIRQVLGMITSEPFGGGPVNPTPRSIQTYGLHQSFKVASWTTSSSGGGAGHVSLQIIASILYDAGNCLGSRFPST